MTVNFERRPHGSVRILKTGIIPAVAQGLSDPRR
jgi:hypothetical protein